MSEEKDKKDLNQNKSEPNKSEVTNESDNQKILQKKKRLKKS